MKILIKILIVFCLLSCTKFDNLTNQVIGEWICLDKIVKNPNYHIDCSAWSYEFHDDGVLKVTDSDSVKFTIDYVDWFIFSKDSIQIDKEVFQFTTKNDMLILENKQYLICLTKTK